MTTIDHAARLVGHLASRVEEANHRRDGRGRDLLGVIGRVRRVACDPSPDSQGAAMSRLDQGRLCVEHQPQGMSVDTFMSITARGLGVEAVATSYAEWALGTESSRTRSARLEEGVRAQWSAAQILASESLVGDHGCRVEMRLKPERMLFRFVHRDNSDGAVFWQVAARVERKGDAVTVEHAVGRDAPRERRLSPVASPSRVVLGLLERDGVEIRPRDLALPPVTITNDAARFVDHVLLRRDRQLPFAVVSCDRSGAPPLVDVERFAKRLRGIYSVAFLATPDATFEFGDTLEARGYGREFRCFHGAVHTYGPTAAMRADHRLWLGDSLRAIEARARTDVVAGLLAHRIAVRDAPTGFFTAIEDFDREERRAIATRLSEKRSTPPPPTNVVPAEYYARVETERQELQAALSKMIVAEQEASAAFVKADDERRAAERAREDAEAQLEQERAISADLREQFQKNKEATKADLDEDQRLALRALVEERLTPTACLRLLELLYGERVVVLDTAYTSADRSSDFRHSGKLFDLMRTLATGYWDALAAGKGDGAAMKAFSSNTFSPNESETTRGNKRAIKERSFTYKGETLVMWRHLKIGAAETLAETIRVHFEWMPAEKKIVVGWCGEHRYRVG